MILYSSKPGIWKPAILYLTKEKTGDGEVPMLSTLSTWRAACLLMAGWSWKEALGIQDGWVATPKLRFQLARSRSNQLAKVRLEAQSLANELQANQFFVLHVDCGKAFLAVHHAGEGKEYRLWPGPDASKAAKELRAGAGTNFDRSFAYVT